MAALVLIPFLAGLLFGQDTPMKFPAHFGLNPLFGGSAFRTPLQAGRAVSQVLIPFLAGLLFGRTPASPPSARPVLIPFLAGLLFGLYVDKGPDNGGVS